MQKGNCDINNKRNGEQNHTEGDTEREVAAVCVLHYGRCHYVGFPCYCAADHTYSTNFRDGAGKSEKIGRENLIDTLDNYKNKSFAAAKAQTFCRLPNCGSNAGNVCLHIAYNDGGYENYLSQYHNVNRKQELCVSERSDT